MEERFGIPYRHVSYFGLDDAAEALYSVSDFFSGEAEIARRTAGLVAREAAAAEALLAPIRAELAGKRAAIYVGGAFKARSLVKALRLIGVDTVLVGSQTGNKDDYEGLSSICDPGTYIVDDSNPAELSRIVKATGAEVFIGGVKERPIAHKLGLGFCDHNHERKIPLAGFEGMVNFARELRASCLSPVWRLVRG